VSGVTTVVSVLKRPATLRAGEGNEIVHVATTFQQSGQWTGWWRACSAAKLTQQTGDGSRSPQIALASPGVATRCSGRKSLMTRPPLGEGCCRTRRGPQRDLHRLS
jgi:hypothetical protein